MVHTWNEMKWARSQIFAIGGNMHVLWWAGCKDDGCGASVLVYVKQCQVLLVRKGNTITA